MFVYEFTHSVTISKQWGEITVSFSLDTQFPLKVFKQEGTVVIMQHLACYSGL